MEKTAGRILRGNEVKLEGSCRLDAGPAAARERSANSLPAQANIVENQPEYALIEVICGCGAKTLIKCEYMNP
ncbi:MAG: hypothetical protein CVV39_00985 [Planctomycetes bacterium HGW-Planctomycetes-1]|nr:MAG: hypothetical protein CVV39_00985 [Planctomycetes bacterium HGW-Planctomycetes-1]